MNTKYRAKAKNDFEKNQYNFLNNSVFGKTIHNGRKQRDILLATNERRNKLASSVKFRSKREANTYQISSNIWNEKEVKINSQVLAD